MGRKKTHIKTLTKKERNRIRKGASRQVAIEEGIEPYKSKVHVNKSKYRRKSKYKKRYEDQE